MTVSQLVYDGRQTHYARGVEQQKRDVAMKKVSVSLHELKQQALRIYFSVLLADQQQELLKTTQNTLKTHLERVHRAIRRGMHLPVDST